MIEDVEPEQLELLSRMVEADRRLPRDQRMPFHAYAVLSGGANEFLSHPGLESGSIPALRSDLMALAEAGYVRISSTGRSSSFNVDIRPIGYRRHAELLGGVADAVEDVQNQPRRHLDGEGFKKRYPKAHTKWSSANDALWAEDAHQNLTRIGHDCTEALQEFATTLVEIHRPPSVESNPGRYIKRLDAVIDLHKAKVGEKRSDLLHALVNYWVKASALAERQEHGVGKAGDELTWDDARRVVFHTAIVMFEIDSALRPP
jgi:hypothetical protein